MKSPHPFLAMLVETPASYVSALLSLVVMVIHITVPACFRLLVDYAIPLKSSEAFWKCMLSAAAGLLLVGLLRAAMRFLQSAARDEIEIRLSKLRMAEQISAIERYDFARVERLNGIARDSLLRIADLIAGMPSQIVGGTAFLVFIIAALAIVEGPVIVAVVGAMIALKVVDLFVVRKQSALYSDRADALAVSQLTETRLLGTAPSLFALRPRQITQSVVGESFDGLRARYRRLREAQLWGDGYLNLSAEFLYLAAFFVAGMQSFYDRMTFGEFVFAVTVLMQLQQPIEMLLGAILELQRMRGLVADVGDALFATPVASPHASPRIPAPVGRFRLGVGGPSGVGKTTLACAWYRQWLTQGTAPDAIAMVPQTLQLFPTVVADYLKGTRRRQDWEAALSLSELIGENRRAEVLSGGERRRLLILRALTLSPKILVLDEPEAGLDELARERLLGVLREFLAESSASVALLSHDAKFLALMEHRIDLGAKMEIRHASI